MDRKAHTPKIIGSNPTPATKQIKDLEENLLGLFFMPGSNPEACGRGMGRRCGEVALSKRAAQCPLKLLEVEPRIC